MAHATKIWIRKKTKLEKKIRLLRKNPFNAQSIPHLPTMVLAIVFLLLLFIFFLLENV